MDRECSVILVAGGSGNRMGGGVPKQLRPLLGLPLFLWSAKFFNGCAEVGEIVLVVPQGREEECRALCTAHSITRLSALVPGGRLRQDSVAAGITASSPAFPLVAVHDAARPFPSRAFHEAVRVARDEGAAILASPVGDTLKRVEGSRITGTVDRTALWAAHTPQVFRRDLLARAMDHCAAKGVEVTDEASAVEHSGGTVHVVECPRSNLKLTTPDDWPLAEVIGFAMQRDTRGG